MSMELTLSHLCSSDSFSRVRASAGIFQNAKFFSPFPVSDKQSWQNSHSRQHPQNHHIMREYPTANTVINNISVGTYLAVLCPPQGLKEDSQFPLQPAHRYSDHHPNFLMISEMQFPLALNTDQSPLALNTDRSPRSKSE